jgi:sugar lactone lactonase YvrE
LVLFFKKEHPYFLCMPKHLETIEIKNLLGEGPLWNESDGKFWWTDIQASRLHRLDPRTRQVETVATPERLGCFAFIAGEEGRILAAFESGVGVFDCGAGTVAWIVRPEVGTGRRFNDGRVDAQGRFWIATMVEDVQRAGAESAALYRFDARGLSVQAGGVRIGNGLCVSPDGGTLYFADSPRQTIHAYDLDQASGALSGRRLFATVDEGYPDGAAVDEEGCVWSARWGAGRVVRHAPDGSVIEVLALPVMHPTCVAFGGADLRLMLITSAQFGAREGDPAAGSVLLFESEVAGLAGQRFDRAGLAPGRGG